MRRLGAIFAGVLLLSACTATPQPVVDDTPPPSPTVEPTPDPEPAPLVSAEQLTDCVAGTPTPRQRVAFAIGGDVWALDDRTGTLTCVFEGLAPGPFAWGPLGDRLLAEDGGIVDVGSDTGPFAIVEELATPYTWSKPTGKSFVYLAEGATQPTKFPVTDDVGSYVLTDLPPGSYESIAYHPSGTSMAVSVMDGDEPQIFIATNEGAREKRVVVGVSATSFPGIAFDTAGTNLYYVAEHKGGYVQVHRLDLEVSELADLWKSTSAFGEATGLFVSPDGYGLTFTASDGGCETSVALRGSGERMKRALRGASGPTHAFGYLDARTVVVGVGGCGEPLDLYAVKGTTATWLVSGVEAGASRAKGSPEPAAPLPEDFLGEVQEFG